ncbi:MAG TPA: helix-turn-helix domain-containing protein [Actinomycetes bacterium]|nr:helix-turn-helix domain-containing protein [Actinomycetes bacterium]
MAEPERRLEITDAGVLAALAHPLRVALLDQLAALGPRTASQCAKALGETPSNCSYHLRQLARAGLAARAEAPDGRERPWRVAWTGLSVSRALAGPEAGPAAHATSVSLIALQLEQNARLARQYLRVEARAPQAWREAATQSNYSLLATPEELRELADALDRAIRPFIGLTRQHPPAGARPVHLDLQAFLRPEAIG